MKCRFRGLADHSHVKQVHVECKANKETAPARGPAGGGVVTRRRNTDGGGGVVTRRRNTDGGGGGGHPEAKHRRRGGGVDLPPLGLFGTANGELSFFGSISYPILSSSDA